ncbi:hypothetical protein A9Q83_13455, partial [Alphaproteobacteria bacterium 46_93_T64]
SDIETPETVTITLTGTNNVDVTASGSDIGTITDVNGSVEISDAGRVTEGGNLSYAVALTLDMGSAPLEEGAIVRVALDWTGSDASANDADLVGTLPTYIDLVVDAGGLTASSAIVLDSNTAGGFEGDEDFVVSGGVVTVYAPGDSGGTSGVVAEGIDADTATGTLEESIVIFNDAFTVQEFALPDGSDPTSDAENSEHTFGVDQTSNSFSWNDDVIVTINGEAKLLTDLTSGGTPIAVTLENGGHDIVGKVGSEVIFTLKLDPASSTGEYEFKLLGQIDHPDVDLDGGVDQITLGVFYSSDTHQGIISVEIVDDAQEAFDNEICGVIGETAPDYNLVFVFDTSGSMSSADVGLEIQSIQSLITDYMAASDGNTVNVTLIGFDGSINYFSGTTTLPTYTNGQAAIDFLETQLQGNGDVLSGGIYDDDGTTNYNAPLVAAQTVLENYIDANDGINKVYFYSDGAPTSGLAAPTGWQSFADDPAGDGSEDLIDVVAIGIGGNIPDTYLIPVANSGGNQAIVSVANAGDLSGALSGNTIVGVYMSGNVVTDDLDGGAIDNPATVDELGADGLSYISSLTVSGSVITFDGTNPSGGTATTDPDEYEFTTTLGNTLTFNFLNGDYLYQGENTGEETINYVIRDGDGDTDGANLIVCVLEPLDVAFAISANQTSISEIGTEEVTFTIDMTGDPLVSGNDASIDVSFTGTSDGDDVSVLGTMLTDDLLESLQIAADAETGVSFDGTTLTFDESFDGSLSFAVSATDDAAIELIETIVVTLINPTITTGTATITDDTVSVDIISDDFYTRDGTLAVEEAAIDENGDFSPGSTPTDPDETDTSSLNFDQGAAIGFEWSTTAVTVDAEGGAAVPLTSGGQPINITVSVDGLTLTGSVGGDPVFELTMTDTATGAYEYTQLGPIDHPDENETGAIDVLELTFNYQSDGYQGEVTVSVEDDGPDAGDQSFTGDIALLDYSVAICVDISTSMNTRHDSNGDGSVNNSDDTRLETATASAIDLAADLFAAGDDVAISLSVFADGSHILGTYTDLSSFTAAVGTIDDAGSSWASSQGISDSTDYKDGVAALEDGMAPMLLDDQSENTQKLAYFLSDGYHNVDSFNSSDWQNFVSTNEVESYAVVIGGDISNPIGNSFLQGVSYDPDDAGSSSANILVVDNPSDLTETLAGTIAEAVSGNIFDGTAAGTYGADGAGGIVSVTAFGSTYTDATGSVLEITSGGHTFTFDFATGDYQIGVASGSPSIDTTITYVIEDDDGDQAMGSIDVDVTVTANAPSAYDNLAYVEQSGSTQGTSLLEGFENESGFDEQGKVGLSNSHDTEGSKSVKIQADGSNIGNLESFIGTTNYFGSELGISDPREGSAISKAITAVDGDVISFDWYFDEKGGNSAPDAAFYVLKSGGTIVEQGILATAQNGNNDGGGTKSLSPVSSGSYTLFIGVVNVNSKSNDSDLFVDNITKFGAIPSTEEVSGNVLDDPMNDPGSSHTWGDTDFVEYGTLLTSVSHDGSPHTVGMGQISFTTALGGTFEIDEHGEYTYTAPSGITGMQEETFTYTLTDISGDEVTATLTVNVAEDSSYMSQTHDGSGSGDTLTGSDVDDIFYGNGGDDIMFGGNGDNYFAGGTGDDTMTGGDHADRFDYTSAADGDDTIIGFDASEGDQIDLHTLFENLGIADEDRAADVNLIDNGSSTTITINNVANFSVTLDSVDLGDHNGDLTSNQLLNMGINIGDES